MAIINWQQSGQQKVSPSPSPPPHSHDTQAHGRHKRLSHDKKGDGSNEGDGGASSSPGSKASKMASIFGTKSWRKSFLATADSLQQETQMEQEFYHERDVTEIEDPKYRRRWYIISPDRPFRKSWDLFQALALFYLALLVPVRVGYDVNVKGTPYLFDFNLELYFMIDFVLNFLTGYENADDHGKIITEPKMIAMNYCRSWMLVDLLGLLPVDLSIRISQKRFRCSFQQDGCDAEDDQNSAQLFKLFKLLRLFRLIKLLRLIRINKLIERYQDDLFRLMPTLSIMRLLGLLLFMGHLFGCFFFFFSTESFGSSLEADPDSWVVKEFGEDFAQKSLINKYVASMYWAFTTMTTMGYGDISAKTRGERIFAILGMIAGAFVYSGVIGSIGSVINNLDLSHQAHRVKMDAVATYVRERALPKSLRKEMLLFFRVQKVSAYNESSLLGEVPMDLRSAIIHHVYGKQMEKCSLFKNCSKHFLTELFARMAPQTFISGTVIFRRGEYANNLYIIIRGKVEMLDPATNLSVITFPQGSYFGEKTLIPPFRHDETMRARTTCKLLSIPKEELDFILEQYEYDRTILNEHILRRYQRVKEEFGKHIAANNAKFKEVQERTVSKAAMVFKRKSMRRMSGSGVTAAAAAASATDPEQIETKEKKQQEPKEYSSPSVSLPNTPTPTPGERTFAEGPSQEEQEESAAFTPSKATVVSSLDSADAFRKLEAKLDALATAVHEIHKSIVQQQN